MNRVIEVLRTVLPVAVMLFFGILCRKKRLISREGINALKSIVVNITLPAVLLHAFASTTYSLMDVVIPVVMFLLCLAAWALGKFSGRLLGLKSKFVPYLTTGFEAGMLGYALFHMLFGAGRTSLCIKFFSAWKGRRSPTPVPSSGKCASRPLSSPLQPVSFSVLRESTAR